MSKRVYTPEYRERLIELVRAGRSPEKLAEEYEPCAATIRAWVKQADLEEYATPGDAPPSEGHPFRRRAM